MGEQDVVVEEEDIVVDETVEIVDIQVTFSPGGSLACGKYSFLN